MESNARASAKELVRVSRKMLAADKELLVLPIAAALFGILGFVLVSGLGLVFGAFTGFADAQAQNLQNPSISSLIPGFLVIFAALYTSTSIGIYFQTAIVIGAQTRIDGNDPTIAYVLREALKRLSNILKWSLITTTVGVLLRALSDERNPLSRIAALVLSISWAIVSFFVLPIVVLEDKSPRVALAESKQLITEKWGKVWRSNIRMDLPLIALMLLGFALFTLGIWNSAWNVDSNGYQQNGAIALISVGLILIIGTTIYMSAVNMYLRVVLLNCVKGREIPGLNEATWSGVFSTRKN